MRLPVYLDHHATTPLDPRVLEAMLPYLRERFGNAGSRSHRYGHEAAAAVDVAREQVAALLGASPAEIVFTSGATESNALAIEGVLRRHAAKPRHVVTVATEHHAVLDCCREAERQGARLSVLPVDGLGRVAPEAVEAALAEDTVLVSVMAANNEVGTLQPLAAIAGCLAQRGVAFHCDAAQAVGKVPLDLRSLAVDLLSLSAHKFGGPKGVGALFIRSGRRRSVPLPLLHGGGQERGLRPGTLNVPGIVGLGKAAELCAAEQDEEALRVGALRDGLQAQFKAAGLGLLVNGDPANRLPGNLSVTFENVDAEELLLAIAADVAASVGAACASGTTAPSHVLLALGLAERLARRTVRFGLGRDTTAAEVAHAGGAVVAAALRLASAPQ